MKRFFLTVMMALFAFTSLTAPVEAKRLGGGGSFGRQAGRMATPPSAPMRQAPPAAPMRQQAQPAQPAPAYPGPAPQQARSGMGGMLGGALLGLGVGSMLGHGANAANGNGNGADSAVNPNAGDSVPAENTGGGSSLLTILMVAVVAYFLYRRFRR